MCQVLKVIILQIYHASVPNNHLLKYDALDMNWLHQIFFYIKRQLLDDYFMMIVMHD